MTVAAVVPDEPPALGDAGWRALLSFLIASAQEQLGSEWRARLADWETET